MLVETAVNATTSQIIGAAIAVHRTIGPGLLESAYLECLEYELTERNLSFRTQVALPMVYKGRTLRTGYRIDLVVEDRVIVEVKSVATLLPVHDAQVITYLKLTACPLGLLINFNEARLIDGVRRLVNPA